MADPRQHLAGDEPRDPLEYGRVGALHVSLHRGEAGECLFGECLSAHACAPVSAFEVEVHSPDRERLGCRFSLEPAEAFVEVAAVEREDATVVREATPPARDIRDAPGELLRLRGGFLGLEEQTLPEQPLGEVNPGLEGHPWQDAAARFVAYLTDALDRRPRASARLRHADR